MEVMDLVEGKDYYFDTDGLMVMTANYHRRRGYCCGQACRHCPYEHVNVPSENPKLRKAEGLGKRERQEKNAKTTK